MRWATLCFLLFALPVRAQVTPIADIHSDVAAFVGQVVTVEAQVYIPGSYRQASFVSAYIQDGSGRGINVFDLNAPIPELDDVGNQVRVTGTVDLFLTTVEIVDVTVQVLSGGNSPLQPLKLATADADDYRWEGTYIGVAGSVLSSSSAGSGRNYWVDDGSGPVIVRVVDSLGVPPFGDGETIAARGAGSTFGSDSLILVGQASDIGPPAVAQRPSTWGGLKIRSGVRQD